MKKFGDPAFQYHVAAARYLGLQLLRLANADLLPLDYEAYGVEVKRYVDELRDGIQLAHPGGLDLAPAEHPAESIARAGRELRGKYENALASPSANLHFYHVNRTLVLTEGTFLLEPGLPNRPWYRHSIFAPGIHNGYRATCLPGVREAIEAGDLEEAKRQLEQLVIQLNDAAAALRHAAFSSEANASSPNLAGATR